MRSWPTSAGNRLSYCKLNRFTPRLCLDQNWGAVDPCFPTHSPGERLIDEALHPPVAVAKFEAVRAQRR